MKLLTTILILSSVVASLIPIWSLVAATSQLYEFSQPEMGASQTSLPASANKLPINDDGLQALKRKDFEGGAVIHYQFSFVPFLPIFLLAAAFVSDRRSLKTSLGKIAVSTAAVFYIAALSIFVWMYSWVH